MERWLKSNPVAIDFSQSNIDRENGIIYNVVMCEAGPAKGHGVHLEDSFIEALVNYDQKHFSKTGVKARFGHPAMSDTQMGTQMGYFKNVRKVEAQAIGDLHLLAAAENSPTKPGMRSWMLDMAEEASEFVMSSIVFISSGYYQYSPKKKERIDFEMEWDAPFPEEDIYVAFDPKKGARHNYTDIVEAGAATNALFGQQFNQDKFAVRTVTWLQENDDILQFIRSNPSKILEMCDKLQIPLTNKEMSKEKPTKESFFTVMRNFFAGEEADEAPETAPEQPPAEAEPVQPTEEAPAEPASPDATGEEAPAEDNQFAALTARFDALEKANKELKADNAALREKHRAKAATYNNEPGEENPGNRYLCRTTLAAGKKR